jgi:hypothetical protein
LFIAIAAICAVSTQALLGQTTVSLKFNHQLGNESFKFNQVSKTPAGYDIKFVRMEYYVSSIRLEHDGGKEIKLDSLYILENASQEITHILGSFNVTKLEKIRFYIGVDNRPNINPNDPSNRTNNHANPALWTTGHPLAPKWPSMHWGWSEGYRFVASEGFAGANTPFKFEIHALGDANYFECSVPINISESKGKLDIVLNADYLKSFDGVDVSRGLIEHSTSGDAVTYLKNFQTKVFSAPNASSLRKNSRSNYIYTISPNPARGKTILRLNESTNLKQTVELSDINGKLIFSEEIGTGQEELVIEPEMPGLYLVNIWEDNKVVFSERIVITQ